MEMEMEYSISDLEKALELIKKRSKGKEDDDLLYLRFIDILIDLSELIIINDLCERTGKSCDEIMKMIRDNRNK